MIFAAMKASELAGLLFVLSLLCIIIPIIQASQRRGS